MVKKLNLRKTTIAIVSVLALFSALTASASAANCYGSYKDNKTGEIVQCK